MELIQIIPAVQDFEFYIVTERNFASRKILENYKHHLLFQQDRSHLFPFIINFSCNIFLSLLYIIKEKPNIIITTGAGASYPTCFIGKILGKKIIYIESFAKITSSSMTGRKIYPFADKFLVQWEEMKKIYPKAEYHGTVY